jgi:hypothetical protein
VNDLEYGHQAMIAYNKKLVLENTGTGLDFTLDQSHEVVPIVSGTANYHTDAWSCWRTAFRECIKLKNSPDVESQYRLRQWLTQDNTKEQWSKKGAEDAYRDFMEKMIQKIGKPVVDATMTGSIWTNAVLHVTTDDGEEQSWKTQMILNFSKYQKMFNQFPSRRIK